MLILQFSVDLTSLYPCNFTSKCAVKNQRFKRIGALVQMQSFTVDCYEIKQGYRERLYQATILLSLLINYSLL